MNGLAVNHIEGGVRPAMWLDLAMAEVALPSPNDLMKFGDYKWRVLEVSDGKALLLSEYVLEQRAYFSVADGEWDYLENVAALATTWADCDLRAYLNGEFLESFQAEDRARIVPTRLSNQDNPWYGTPGGADTDDFIFLLSIEEALRYFGDSGDLASRRAWTIDESLLEFVVDNENGSYLSDQYNEARKAYSNPTSSISYDWWLRSPGFDFRAGEPSHWASSITSEGLIRVGGDFVDNWFTYVRPAMWVKLFPSD
jgi:hypothetical protein